VELEQAGAVLLAEARGLFLFLYHEPPNYGRGWELETLVAVARPDLSHALESVGKALQDEFKKHGWFPLIPTLPGYKVQNARMRAAQSRAYALLIHEPETQPVSFQKLSAYRSLEALVLRLLRDRVAPVATTLHFDTRKGGGGGGAPAEARVAAPSLKKRPLN
jgi:hypothetical protein